MKDFFSVGKPEKWLWCS